MKKYFKDDELGYTKGLLLFVDFFLFCAVFSFACVILSLGFKFYAVDLDLTEGQNLFTGFFSTLFLTIILHFIRKILITVKNKNPFCLENVKRLRVLGFTFIALEILIATGVAVITYYDLKIFSEMHRFFPGYGGFITGGIMLVLSEVFRIGIKLKNENKLTI